MLPSPDPRTLQAFLEHPSRPAGTRRYHELQGFLFTVVSAPDRIPPSDWLPIVFSDQEVDYASRDEAQEILGQIMVLYNTVNAAVMDAPTLLPADCPLRDDVLANFEDAAPMAQWSRGFLLGHQWLEELWKEHLPEELAEELAATLMTLTFFSSRALAEAFVAKNTGGGAVSGDRGRHDPRDPPASGRAVRPHGPVNRRGADGARRGGTRAHTHDQGRSECALPLWQWQEVQALLRGDPALSGATSPRPEPISVPAALLRI